VAQTADELEADIAHTREDMSATLGAIGDQVSPKRVVESVTHRIRRWIESARDGIMGSASEVEGYGGQGGAEVGGGGEHRAPGTAAMAAQNQGNPLAAGLIAFGAGLLVGSLLPATKVEQQGLSAIADKAEPAIDAAVEAASELGHGLQQSAEQAASQLGEALTDASQQIADQTKDLNL
jgi:Protein of unknown function (DUF3618)